MDNKKNPKIGAARRRKTGGSRCFKKGSFKGNRYAKNNDLTNISYNTTEHQVSSTKKLRKSSIHIQNSEQSPHLLIDLDIFSQIFNVIGLCPWFIYYQHSKKERIKLTFRVHLSKLFRMD